MFCALDAKLAKKAESDDLEEQHLVLLTRKELDAALDDGLVKMLPWAAAIALALRVIDSKKKHK